jgi:hypothetical protein
VSFGDLGVGNSGSSNIWRVKKAEKGKDIALSKEEGKKNSFLARGVKGEGESGRIGKL